MPGGQETPLLRAVRGCLPAGGVVAGTSAGAAIMSRSMFRDAPDNHMILKGLWREGKEFDRGLGFNAARSCLWTSFPQSAAASGASSRCSLGLPAGPGVEENSAIVVGNLTRWRRSAARAWCWWTCVRPARTRLPAFNLQGVRPQLPGPRRPARPWHQRHRRPHASWLSRASTLRRRTAKPYYRNAGLLPRHARRPDLAECDGAPDRNAAPELRGLAFRARPRAEDPAPSLGFEFQALQGPGTVGWYYGGQGSEEYTVLNVRLDVLPVRVASPLFTPLEPGTDQGVTAHQNRPR